MKLLLILLFSLLSCAADDYTCEVTVRHVAETLHNLPVEVVVGYETHLIPPNQSVVLTVFKNTDHLDVCINSFSAKNEGHTSMIEIYSGFSFGGKLVVGKRTIFDNRPQLCAFRIYADNDCVFKVLR